jgi:hypothetical protein
MPQLFPPAYCQFRFPPEPNHAPWHGSSYWPYRYMDYQITIHIRSLPLSQSDQQNKFTFISTPIEHSSFGAGRDPKAKLHLRHLQTFYRTVLGVMTTFDVDSGSRLQIILNTFIQRRDDVTVLLTQYDFRFNCIPQLAVTNYQPTQTHYLAFESESLTNV